MATLGGFSARLPLRTGGALLFPFLLQAGELPIVADPTRPAPPAVQSTLSLARGPWRISLLLVGTERTVAIINGQEVQPGSKVGPATVKSIDTGGVTLELEGKEIRLPQNVCFRIDTGAEGRRLVHQEGLCSGEEPPAHGVIPLQRHDDGRFSLQVEIDGVPMRFRLAPAAERSLLPAAHAAARTPQLQPTGHTTRKKGETAAVGQLRVGAVTLNHVPMGITGEALGVLGRDILERLGRWRLDDAQSRLVLEE